MNAGIELTPNASAVLREAATWRMVGLLLECPTPDWHEQVAALAGELADVTLASAAESARREATPELYHSTFGPGGPAAPREVSYRRGVLPGAALAELRALYDVFAYRPSVDEPPDHVAVQAGFVAYLRFKQAYALAAGDGPCAELCDATARRFVSEHVSRISGKLADALNGSGIHYLAATGQALHLLAGSPPVETSLPILDEDADDAED